MISTRLMSISSTHLTTSFVPNLQSRCSTSQDDVMMVTYQEFYQKKELKERPFKMSFGDSSFFVYDEPLLFSTEKQEDSLENLAFYRCVALFNLALVCHLRSYNVDSWSVYKALSFLRAELGMQQRLRKPCELLGSCCSGSQQQGKHLLRVL
jgi:hypothetical protein